MPQNTFCKGDLQDIAYTVVDRMNICRRQPQKMKPHMQLNLLKIKTTHLHQPSLLPMLQLCNVITSLAPGEARTRYREWLGAHTSMDLSTTTMRGFPSIRGHRRGGQGVRHGTYRGCCGAQDRACQHMCFHC